MSHNSLGNMSVLEAAHCPSYVLAVSNRLVSRGGRGYPKCTLMNAGPAHSMERTRKPYHHRVPLRSLSRSGCRFPIQMAGIVKITGMKMAASCKNRKPVHIGSQRYISKNRTTFWGSWLRALPQSWAEWSSSFRGSSSLRSLPAGPWLGFDFSDSGCSRNTEKAKMPPAVATKVPWIGRRARHVE
jgi:hypothetical protein